MKSILARFSEQGDFERKSGTGKDTPVMTKHVQKIALQIHDQEKGDLTYREWSSFLSDEGISVSTEKLRTWFLNDLGGHYAPKRVKPILSDATKLKRFKLATEGLKDGLPLVAGDEGWSLTINPKRRHIKLLPPESGKEAEQASNTTLHVQSKSNIPKVMVITLITRPRAVPGVGYVGGQVGIWRVWDEYAAKRRSWKNDPANPDGPRIIAHEKGDVYMKDCHVNGDFYLRWGRKHAIPALVNNFSIQAHASNNGGCCVVQHDNSTSHNSAHAQLNKAGGRYKGGNLKIKFVRQPPDSPDFNRNDLGLYSSLWSKISKKVKMKMMTTDMLWETVSESFWSLPSTQFEILYRTQLEILKLVIETKGDNNFSVPHTGIREAVLKNHAQLMSRRKRKRYKTDPKVTN